MSFINVIRTNKKNRIQELVIKLNEASDAYYNGKEIISNFEYDELFDELKQLEEETGIIFPNSPTINVGASCKVDKLNKVKHRFPAKSLDKTKDIDLITDKFIEAVPAVYSLCTMFKLDGCTLQLTYDEGKLVLAVTRGDGYIGQDITHNAKYIKGIPLNINYEYELVVRGEALMSYSDFDRINSKLDADNKYKNPRNLASASITMLDPEDMKDRNIMFKVFEFVFDGNNNSDTRLKTSLLTLDFWNLRELGFDIVGYELSSSYKKSNMVNVINSMTEKAKDVDYPVDGLVLRLEDLEYTSQFQGTEHHPHIYNGYAFKWEDEVAKTKFKYIEWSTSRTGTLTPVAIFDTVEIDGTDVGRASLHNVSILENLNLITGDEIGVIKANMIIPQVVKNYSSENRIINHIIPVKCPSCGEVAQIIESEDSGVKNMVCTNSQCPAKHIESFSHFVSRDALNIEGLSEATLTKLISNGYIHNFTDLYTLDKYENDIKNMEGFGETSWSNLWDAINKSKNTTFQRVIVGLGIPGIGVKQAKVLAKYFDYDMFNFLNNTYDLSEIEGFGNKTDEVIKTWLSSKDNQYNIRKLLSYLTIEKPDIETANKLSGKVFVITGKLDKFDNRKQLESLIEDNGGKVSSSVSNNTNYLINNDINSTSSKNKKANELNIPIINETAFIELLNK